jgi:hypothetical protein
MIKYFLKKILTQSQIDFLRCAKVYALRTLKNSSDIYSDYRIISLGEQNRHTFFGYYDITPFNTTSNEILYLTLGDDLKNADIVVEDIKSGTKTVVANTRVWNWQQGCRLRWFPNCSDEIIFNDFRNGTYYSRIINIRNNKENILDFPLYDINRTGTLGVSLDFSRLGVKRPGYGYTLMPYSEPIDLSSEAIHLIDIKQNTGEKIITYKQIDEKIKNRRTDYKNAYLNHLSFSPSGGKFLFFYLDASTPRHETYMLAYEINENKLHVIEPEMKVSHYVWEDDNHIIATSYNQKNICGYYRYSIDGRKEQILPNVLTRDGHPSLYKNGKILTDTYPDKAGYQSLLLFDGKMRRVDTLAKIFSSPKYTGEKRTDLHPRFNDNKTRISFDANINGFRNIYYFDI